MPTPADRVAGLADMGLPPVGLAQLIRGSLVETWSVETKVLAAVAPGMLARILITVRTVAADCRMP
jgi:hypothetical protein